MEEIKFTRESIEAFLQEKTDAGNKAETIAEYRRILLKFQHDFLPDDMIRKNTLQEWKSAMQQEGVLAVRTINRRLAVVNQYLEFMGERNWQVSCVPLEDTAQTVLQRSEYIRLLQAAKQQKKEQLYFIIKSICVLGLHIWELPELTVNIVKKGSGVFHSNGQERKIAIPKTFQRELLDYCKRNDILEGRIFRSQKGTDIHRITVNAAMKQLCQIADVAPEKANPRCLLRLYEQTQTQLQDNVAMLLLQYYDKLLEAEEMMTGWEQQ
ncbi:hypothetical protein [Anaerotignum sp.]|uniref:hypothetical protein n=1 Tax=Anaerotignum sp. TaxID=2039241 RepID=UPI0037361E50